MVVLGTDLLDVPLVEIDLVGVLEEDGQLLVVQPLHGHLAVLEQLLGLSDLVLQLALVALKEHQVIEAVGDLSVGAVAVDLVDAVVLHLDPGLELVLFKDAVLVALAEHLQLFVFLVQVAVVHDGPLQLHDVGAVAGMDGPEHPAQAVLDGVVPSVLAEEAEFHGIDLKDRPVVRSVQIFDIAVLDPGEGDDLLHVGPALLGVLRLGEFLHGDAALFFSSLADGFLFFFGSFFALEDPVLFLSGLFPGLGLKLGFLFAGLFDRAGYSPVVVASGLQPRLFLSPGFGLLLSADPSFLGSGELSLASLSEGLVEGGLLFALLPDLFEHLIVPDPLEAALVTDERKDVEYVYEVGLLVHPEEQEGRQRCYPDEDPALPGKIRDQHEDDHRHGDPRDYHVAQGHALEQLYAYFCFTGYKSRHFYFLSFPVKLV